MMRAMPNFPRSLYEFGKNEQKITCLNEAKTTKSLFPSVRTLQSHHCQTFLTIAGTFSCVMRQQKYFTFFHRRLFARASFKLKKTLFELRCGLLTIVLNILKIYRKSME